MEINDYESYIQDMINNRLERLLGNPDEEYVNMWQKYGGKDDNFKKYAEYKNSLHVMLVPYYKRYLNGDTKLCCEGCKLEHIGREMNHFMDEDELFGNWASEQDLIDAAEGWGNNLKFYEKEDRRINRFFNVLEALLKHDCQQDWVSMSEELKEGLFKAEVCYNYKTDEVMCVLHAFSMIMQQDWDKEKKASTFKLLKGDWLFLKHYYSVMIRHIIGVKWTKFSKVAETVLNSSQKFRPHMHIFYSGLMDCVDELNLDKRHRKEMDKIILQMHDELKRCTPSDILYELCDALFPESFQRLLREHRPKSYKEIEDENQRKDDLLREMEQQNKKLHSQLGEAERVLEQMVQSAIPIEDIDKELMKYPVGVAWELLNNLNANPVVNMQPAWREHYPTLLKKYRERLFEPIEEKKELKNTMMQIAQQERVGQVVLEQNNYGETPKYSIGKNGYRVAELPTKYK